MDILGHDSLYALMVYLAGPAGTTAWFIAVSAFFKNFRERGNLSSWKPWAVQLLVAAVSFSIPVICLVVIQNVPQADIVLLEPWFALVGAGSIAYLAQQGYYLATKPGREAG